jgi:hypothetical protein
MAMVDYDSSYGSIARIQCLQSWYLPAKEMRHCSSCKRVCPTPPHQPNLNRTSPRGSTSQRAFLAEITTLDNTKTSNCQNAEMSHVDTTRYSLVCERLWSFV